MKIFVTAFLTLILHFSSLGMQCISEINESEFVAINGSSSPSDLSTHNGQSCNRSSDPLAQDKTVLRAGFSMFMQAEAA